MLIDTIAYPYALHIKYNRINSLFSSENENDYK